MDKLWISCGNVRSEMYVVPPIQQMRFHHIFKRASDGAGKRGSPAGQRICSALERLGELDVPAFLELSQLLCGVMLDECGLVKLAGVVVHNAVGPLGGSTTVLLTTVLQQCYNNVKTKCVRPN